MAAFTLIACLECDLLHRRTPLPPGGEARCTRCGARLYRSGRPHANELALALAACIVFIVANVFPIVALELQGVRNSATLMGAVESLWDDGARAVAALVFVTTVLVPAAELSGLTWVLVALRRGGRRRGVVPLLHFIESVKPWGMVEVFVLGASPASHFRPTARGSSPPSSSPSRPSLSSSRTRASGWCVHA